VRAKSRAGSPYRSCRPGEGLRREGHAEGEAKGKAEGKAEGRAETLLKLLALRFGSVPDGVLTKVESAARRTDLAALDRWVERVLSKPSAEDVVADD